MSITVHEYAIFRVEKLSRGGGKSSIRQSLRHLEKHDKVADIVNPKNTPLNKSKNFFSNKADLNKFIKEKIAEHNSHSKRALRSDASIAVEAIFTFSPSLVGKVNIAEWMKENMKFFKTEFTDKGCTPVRIDLHMDEETPHIHAVFIPTTKDGKISAKQYLGGKATLSKMQTRYAERMERFGMERGYSRFDEYKKIMNDAEKEGFPHNHLGVRDYCKKHGIKVPSKRSHRTKMDYLKELDQKADAVKIQIEGMQQDVEDMKKDGRVVSSMVLKQLDDEVERVKFLEGFIESDPEVKSRYREYLQEDNERDRDDGIERILEL